MKTVMIPRVGGPEVLAVVDLSEPTPGPGQVAIRVHAATVNPTDLGLRVGAWQQLRQPPYIPGMDLAGVVRAVGPEVSDWQIGDEVMAMVLPTRPEGGAQAEVVLVSQDAVATIPRGSSLVEASTLPMNGLTVHRAFDLLGLPKGATVAVTGSAGAVGGYAIQWAKAAGYRVIADGAPKDVQLLRSLGADVVVPRGEAVAEAILREMPGGVDALIDAAVQGMAVLPAVRDGGQIAALRHFNGVTERGILIHQVSVADYAHHRRALEELAKMVESGALSLRVAATLAPEQASEAHRKLAAGGVRGRLVIVF